MKKNKTLNVTINRKKWKRGNDGVGSALLTETGQCCCLGFVAKACGIRLNQGYFDFRNLDSDDLMLLPQKLRTTKFSFYSPTNTSLHNQLIFVNDSGDDWHGKTREAEIKRLLKLANVNVKFV